MKHSKIIVLNGIERGGTGIVWNILQSHPQLCSPILETGEILFGELFRSVPARISMGMLTSRITMHSPLGLLLSNIVDNCFFKWKMENFGHAQNGTKHDNVQYSHDEVKNTFLCLKGVNQDIHLTDFFAKFYKEAFFIGLIRNGYALCNGWIRRGHGADEAGRMYKTIGQSMISYHETQENYILVRFEDVLMDPFGVAEKLFSFSRLHPVSLEKLRLKSSKVLSPNGEHKARFGKEKTKYWCDSKQITSILDPGINETQIGLLNDTDLIAFERHAGPVLDYFQYT